MICIRIRSGSNSHRAAGSAAGAGIREQLQGNPLPEIKAGSGSGCSSHRQQDPLPEIGGQGGSRDPLADDLYQDPERQQRSQGGRIRSGCRDPEQLRKLSTNYSLNID